MAAIKIGGDKTIYLVMLGICSTIGLIMAIVIIRRCSKCRELDRAYERELEEYYLRDLEGTLIDLCSWWFHAIVMCTTRVLAESRRWLVRLPVACALPPNSLSLVHHRSPFLCCSAHQTFLFADAPLPSAAATAHTRYLPAEPIAATLRSPAPPSEPDIISVATLPIRRGVRTSLPTRPEAASPPLPLRNPARLSRDLSVARQLSTRHGPQGPPPCHPARSPSGRRLSQTTGISNGLF
jgi:hypothetical protein